MTTEFVDAELWRIARSEQGTLGVLTDAQGVRVCYMLELPWYDNRRSISCIPAGVVHMKLRYSPSRGWCYWVYDAPERDWILQHSGNFAGDTALGWKTHSLGCQLPGMRYGTMDGQLAVFQSRTAVRVMQEYFEKKPIRLTIKEVIS